MAVTNGSGDEVWEKRHPRLRKEEFSTKRIKRRIDQDFDAGNVYFRVFRSGVISMDHQRACREQSKVHEVLELHPGGSPWRRGEKEPFQGIYSFLETAQILSWALSYRDGWKLCLLIL